jgi:hypothetical protein
VTTWPNGNTAEGGQGQAVAGLACTPPDTTFHVHAHLSILRDGQALAIPANIGIVRTVQPNCFYNVHTHDLSGRIHIEGPVPIVTTLGQLFAIWGMPLSRENVAGLTGMPVEVWITDDGVVRRHEDADLGTIELRSHRNIAIQVGTPVTELPYFVWSGQ